MLKVLHISTSDTGGGAAKAAYKLHREMLNQGVFSRMLVLHKYSNDDTVYQFQFSGKLLTRIGRRIRRFSINIAFRKYKKTLAPHFELFSGQKTPLYRDFNFPVNDYDIIQLHFISGFLDYATFFQYVKVPVFWRLADMNPFTGGCHYSWDCTRYSTECGNCPLLGSSKHKDLSNRVLKGKRQVFNDVAVSQLHFIALSKWMKQQFLSSSVFNRFAISLIPNGVEMNIFRPVDKQVVRDIMGLPQDRRIILLIAEDLNNIRKGANLGFEALSLLGEKEQYFLLLVGRFSGTLGIGIDYHSFGPVSEKKFLASIYASADVFLFTSLQENFANTVIESMACGTPVVAFNTGGIQDVIKDQSNGYIAGENTSGSLAKAVEKVYSDRESYLAIRRNSVSSIEQQYNIKDQAGKYIELYKAKPGG